MLDPTQDQRELVVRLARANIDIQVIADTLGMPLTSLQKTYPTELANAGTNAIEAVATALYDKAIEGNVAAAKFFLESRAGWIAKADEGGPKNKVMPFQVILDPVALAAHNDKAEHAADSPEPDSPTSPTKAAT